MGSEAGDRTGARARTAELEKQHGYGPEDRQTQNTQQRERARRRKWHDTECREQQARQERRLEASLLEHGQRPLLWIERQHAEAPRNGADPTTRFWACDAFLATIGNHQVTG